MKLIVNGIEIEMADGITIAELVKLQGFNPDVIVIEYNQRIVTKEEWNTIVMRPKDSLEVVTFVGGG